MKKRLTTEEFILRSKSVWGENTFDYSKVEYTNNKTKITFKCVKHNLWFNQASTHHLRGCCGCTECVLEKTGSRKNGYWTYERCVSISKEYGYLSDFIKREPKCYDACKERGYLKDFMWLKRHYDENEDVLNSEKHLIYCYAFPEFNSVYVGLTMNLEKRDEDHGFKGSVFEFCKEQNISKPKPIVVESGLTITEVMDRERYWIEHYKKLGYNLLNKTKGGDSVGLLTCVTREKYAKLFITKAKELYKDKYDYSQVIYRKSIEKVIIICPIHGKFEKSPHNHLQGQGCPKCSRMRKK